MARVTGLLSLPLIAGLPVLVLPDQRMLIASLATTLVCAFGLIWPSLWIATAGAVLAILAFVAALLLAPPLGTLAAAAVLGVALLALLDAAYFAECFPTSSAGPDVARAHAAGLAVSMLLSIVGLGALVVGADMLWLGLDASMRPVVAAGGGVMVMVALAIAGLRGRSG